MFWFEISPLILVRCTLAPSKMNGAKIETFINSPMIEQIAALFALFLAFVKYRGGRCTAIHHSDAHPCPLARRTKTSTPIQRLTIPYTETSIPI